jgi:hypothetical protein
MQAIYIGGYKSDETVEIEKRSGRTGNKMDRIKLRQFRMPTKVQKS